MTEVVLPRCQDAERMSDSNRGFDDAMPVGRGRAEQGPDPELPLDVARGIVSYLNSDDCAESSGDSSKPSSKSGGSC